MILNLEVQIWRNTKVISIIILILLNVIDPIKKNFTLLLSTKEILDELEIFKGDYYRALLISKGECLRVALGKTN